MPACRQCGKDNPEGTVFCGYCATPLARPGANPVSPPKPSSNPVSPPPSAQSSAPQPKATPPPNPFKPQMRTPVIHSQQSPPPPTDFGPSSSGGGSSGTGGGNGK